METSEIIETLQNIRLGDKLAINDWKAKYTVCGISPNYVLAHYGQHYTIIAKQPTSNEYCFNGVRGGEIRCAPSKKGTQRCRRRNMRPYSSSPLWATQTSIGQKEKPPKGFNCSHHTNLGVS